MRLPLSEEGIALLGETTAYATLMEGALETAVAALVVPAGELDRALSVLAGMQTSSLIEALRRVGPQAVPDEAQRVGRLAQQLQEANAKRNHFVHTVWLFAVADLASRPEDSAVMGLRRKRSGNESTTMDLEEMRATRDAVRDAHGAVIAFTRELEARKQTPRRI